MTVIPLHAYDASSAVKLTIVLFLVIFFLYYGRHIVVLLRRRAIVQRYALGRIIISREYIVQSCTRGWGLRPTMLRKVIHIACILDDKLGSGLQSL